MKNYIVRILDKITANTRKAILLTGDVLLTLVSLQLSTMSLNIGMSHLYVWVAALIIIRLALFVYYGMYSQMWRYASTSSFVAFAKAITFSSILAAFLLLLNTSAEFNRSLLLIEWAFSMILIGTSRLSLRLVRDFLVQFNKPLDGSQINVLIIGAGDAGYMVGREILRATASQYKLIGFLDDKRDKKGQLILNSPVLGTTDDITQLVERYNIDEVIIAIPSANGKTILTIANKCKESKVKCKTTPALYEIINGNVSVNQFREVRIEDLLGRKTVAADFLNISPYLENKVILVTGAGGSIGSELCRQIVQYRPKQLILLDMYENGVYEIEMEMREFSDSVEFIPKVVDIKARDRLETVFNEYRPSIVFHAAAYKHVPLMEENIIEVVLNNIFGTRNLLELSNQYEVDNFVLISTDKAVNPVNCMGASKRLCEMLMQIQNRHSKTNFCAVRFGNVLGSNGSVVRLFKRQIAAGGPVTVTHPDMTRYFMTIPEAVGLVIHAAALNKNGEIFILDMGEPVKILQLAKDMIELSGLEVDKDIEIKTIGLRPGEKMIEELSFSKEGLKPTVHDKVFVTDPVCYNEPAIKKELEALTALANANEKVLIKQRLLEITKTFVPTSDKEDFAVASH